MSWTYTPDFTLDRDQIRFLIQDTQSNRPLVADEEIAWVRSTEANVFMAAAALCDSLASKGGNIKARVVGDLRVVYDVKFYRGLAASLRARGAGHQVPFAGGISITDKAEQQSDSDAVQPRAFRSEMDNPLASQPSPGDGGYDPLKHTP